MKKYEICEVRVELRFPRGAVPYMSAQDVFHLSVPGAEYIIDSEYETLDEARAALEKARVHARAYKTTSNAFDLLCGRMYYLQEAEYDEDGDLDQAQIVDFVAEPYPGDDA